MFLNGEWGTVCDDGWDINDAHVACRELGYSYALSYQCCARYGRGSGRIWLDDVGCLGGESSLLNCSHNGIGVLRSCSHSEDVGVVCYQTSATGTLHKCNVFKSVKYIYVLTLILRQISCGWLVEWRLAIPSQDDWKCSSMENGALCVMMGGASMMPMLLAES